jgi:lysophospholipase
LRSDGYSNLLNSLIIAGHFDIPEVLVIFENKIFRGNRSKKMNSDSFSGFDSPNFDPLVKLGVDFEINWENILLPEKKIKTSLFS